MAPCRRRIFVLLFLTLGVFASLMSGPATALSGTCAPATGIVSAEGEGWILTSSEMVQRFDSAWNGTTPISMDGARAIERGPDGSLWTLMDDRVVRRGVRFDPQTNISLKNSHTNGSNPQDLVYVGQWLILLENGVLAYDDQWENGTVLPGMFDQLPNSTTGLTATDESLVAITQDGTIHVYDLPENSSIEHRRSFSANLTNRAVDLHRESPETWIVLEPDRVTTVTGGGERIGQEFIVFDCTRSGGVNILLTMLGFAAIGVVSLLSIGIVLWLIVRIVRSLL